MMPRSTLVSLNSLLNRLGYGCRSLGAFEGLLPLHLDLPTDLDAVCGMIGSLVRFGKVDGLSLCLKEPHPSRNAISPLPDDRCHLCHHPLMRWLLWTLILYSFAYY